MFMVSEPMQKRIEDEEIEGWELYEERADKVVLVKRKYGTLGGHALIAILTVWWTAGLGNATYAAYKYFFDADKKVIREEDVRPSGHSSDVYIEEDRRTAVDGNPAGVDQRDEPA